ncbi:RNA polymerase I-specific transcription initiation factor RRN3 [Phanerochaete sordida]|uniref:RNA polymerase I-specific transcription initiation factor RRN3 n=1 Tax=Phanerochaete sordida TaxID=48140 RepID=A0A9P3FXT3_9APHY|nr:RNA polymerase I-specific transcription initiation factor RRN3 [Phanerochaete sordida]
MDLSVKTTNPLETYKKRATTRRDSTSSNGSVNSRPVVTNSRVKQDEQYRKDMYLAFINNALQQKAKGISEAFDELVDQFNPKQANADSATTSAQLRLWILALSHVVSRLERVHSALVEAVISMQWTTMDNNFVKSYTSFVGMLVSAKPEYLTLVLGKIASGFTYQSGLQALDASMPETSSQPLTRRTVYDRLHYLLEHLLTLVPTLPSTLQPLLAQNFPHKRLSQASQVTYIRNLLRITEYCPELSDRILATIIDRAIQIDVEIQVELEELEEQAAEEQSELFDFDPFDTVVGQEGESDSENDSDSEDGDNLSDLSSEADGEADDDEPQEEEPTNFQHVQDMVNKLDAILKNVFDHFTHSHIVSNSPPSSTGLPTPIATPGTASPSSPPLTPHPMQKLESVEELKALKRSQFFSLLSIFERTILRTFKSRYTQFLVFWFSSLDPEFSDLFQGMLVSKALLEEDQPTVTRAAAASYIASFVSRAVFVGRESTRQVVACLCNFLANRLAMLDAGLQGGAPPSAAAHSVFYAVTQAVFLIFCFRWRDLTHENDEHDELAGAADADGAAGKWMPELEILRRVVQSDLNPLKICAPSVVMQFARVAHATDFLYCYPLIEANRRSEYASAGTPAARRLAQLLGGAVQTDLNTFFPFDPYKLPRSGAYIEGVYREWAAVAIDDEEDDDDEEEDSAGEPPLSSSYSYDGLSSPVPLRPRGNSEADQLGASFGGMSISPAHPQISMSLSSVMSVS